MYCRECGEKIENPNAAICIKCGTKKGQGKKFCFNCGESIKNENAEVCLSCGCKVKNLFSIPDGNNKGKLVSGLLAFFVGYLGIHRFYLGYTVIGIIQLALFILGIFTCGITSIITEVWVLIDFILIIAGKMTDANGNPLE